MFRLSTTHTRPLPPSIARCARRSRPAGSSADRALLPPQSEAGSWPAAGNTPAARVDKLRGSDYECGLNNGPGLPGEGATTVSWLSAFKLRMNTLAIVLIPVCIAIDWAGHAIASTLKLPLFLDSIGTVLGGLLAGPWGGGLAGFITNLISSGTVDPIAAPYSVISLLIGFAAGIGGYHSLQRRRLGWLAAFPGRVLVGPLRSSPP